MAKRDEPRFLEVISQQDDERRTARYTVLGEMTEYKCSACGLWKFAGPHRYDIGGDTRNGKPICKSCAR